MKNCKTCYYANWVSNYTGFCEYPVPACVHKYELRMGVYEYSEGTSYRDYSKVGILISSDNSVIEVKDCPCWEKDRTRLPYE